MTRAPSSKSQAFLRRYDYTAQFFDENWAWEFLRRDPAFKTEALAGMHKAPEFDDAACGVPIAQMKSAQPQANKWGLLFFPDPRKSSLHTNVFWSPVKYPRRLQVSVVACTSNTVDDLREKSLEHCKVFHLTDPDGDEYLMVRGSGSAIQVSCVGLSLLSANPVKMEVRATGYTHPHGVAAWLARLNQILKSETDPELALAHPYPRLRNALVALDAFDAGLSIFETASILFGEAPANDAWRSGSRAMKDKVRRLRQKGIGLRAGEYTTLLT